ncbi:MAG: hypothetical protein IPP98_06405 [Gemmatimonadetes bacterium]|nr:hypothetical protein [Gemmatimonadota bacterium]
MLVGFLALATLTGTVTGPTAPQRYRIEVKAQQEVDMSAMGGGKQTSDLGVIGFVSVTMSDTTGGQLAHIVVDSIVIPAGIELPPQLGDAAGGAKGVFFHGVIINGKAKDGLKPSAQNPLVALLAGGVENLFPGLRPAAKVGDTWSDTVKTDKSTDGVKQNSTTLLNWTVSTGTMASMTFDATTTGTMMSEGPSPNGKQTINAKISGTRSLTGPAIGPMTKGTIKAMQDLLVSIEGMADSIPVSATTEVTFTIIP